MICLAPGFLPNPGREAFDIRPACIGRLGQDSIQPSLKGLGGEAVAAPHFRQTEDFAKT
jgi:hypothetical protein